MNRTFGEVEVFRVLLLCVVSQSVALNIRAMTKTVQTGYGSTLPGHPLRSTSDRQSYSVGALNPLDFASGPLDVLCVGDLRADAGDFRARLRNFQVNRALIRQGTRIHMQPRRRRPDRLDRKRPVLVLRQLCAPGRYPNSLPHKRTQRHGNAADMCEFPCTDQEQHSAITSANG